MEENKESQEMTISQNSQGIVQGLEGFTTNSSTKQNIITTITDAKVLFNLETACDEKLNNCEGEKIKIKDILCKIIEKPLKEPILDEETGEVLKESEFKMITIIIDEQDKSYVTASKTFFFQFKKLCQVYGDDIKGQVIQIVKVPVKNSDNKALSFKLL